ncbi:MAG: hypothetical protein C0613_08400 [Desulfobulbaceae bacterium]|nr:MAG: hypothetical protein C0613_08400 [Desulfobulbaceae bacterium]
MAEAAAAVLAIVAMLLKHWFAKKEKENVRDYKSDTQRFDRALADRDADDLSRLFDELRRPTTGDGDPGGPDDQGAAGR